MCATADLSPRVGVQKNDELEIARRRKAEVQARSYADLHSSRGTASDEDEEWQSRQREGDFDPDDDFM